MTVEGLIGRLEWIRQYQCDCIEDQAIVVHMLTVVRELAKDRERLDWLARHQTINYGLGVGGYFFKSDLRWQEDRIREAIDAARKAASDEHWQRRKEEG
jgi:phosphoglycerate-specific signal transduction histidine kinase